MLEYSNLEQASVHPHATAGLKGTYPFILQYVLGAINLKLIRCRRWSCVWRSP